MPSIKHHIPSVTDNTCWQLGKGDQINFWTDSWVGDPLVDLLDIPRHSHALLQAKVAHFIANDHWLIPHSITSSYPNLVPLLNSVTIPISKANDELRWIHSDSGEFIILKVFDVNVHHPKTPVIKEVLWKPPLYNWVKCNTDGSALGSPGLASCGGIFRDYTATFLGGFSINIGNSYALHAELIGVMSAIEIAHSKGWNNLWIESDSQLVNLAFKSAHIVPWKLRNRWFNCLTLTKTMHFRATHIYREGNCCADRMVALGINVNGFYWWDNVSPSVQGDYISNLMGLPSFRFH
ncbi:unnamed protein product [Trifolium pratense]|uniref:Uncharacterized protein n=1 Tax=Trifolium pratense TaxID=57577 RepID=A0ACB0IWN7_TRIPR|nr:unnamed protein product [Trifolium pratense]